MGVRLKAVEEELVHIDQFPNQCGFFTSDTDKNNGYGCTFPEGEVDGWFKKAHPGCCYGWDCPFAYEADLEDLKKHDSHLYAEYKDEKYGPHECGSGWLIKLREVVEYHKRCADCGQFVEEEKWVRKDDPHKDHALCSECFGNYDDPGACP